jgi:hypothetical protein
MIQRRKESKEDMKITFAYSPEKPIIEHLYKFAV